MKRKLLPSACLKASIEAGVAKLVQVHPGLWVLKDAYAVTDTDYFATDEPKPDDKEEK